MKFGDVRVREGHRVMVLFVAEHAFSCGDWEIIAEEGEAEEGFFSPGLVICSRLEPADGEPVGYVDGYAHRELEEAQ